MIQIIPENLTNTTDCGEVSGLERTKTRNSERSRIVSPALQQAVESAVAELEEATFGRGKWFDIEDDVLDNEKRDIAYLRETLLKDFKKNKIRKELQNV